MSQETLQAVTQAIDAGGSLPDAMRAISSEFSGRPARTLSRIADKLEQGQALDQLISDSSLGMDRHTAAAVQAGLKTGRISAVLTELSEQYRAASLARKQLLRSLAYPSFVFAFAISIVIMIMRYLVPPFREVAEDFGTTLPAVTTEVFWWASTGLRIVGLASLCVVAAFMAFRVFLGKANWQWLVSTIPVLGAPLWWSATAEFARLLKILLQENVALGDALEITADSISDASIGLYSRQAADAVRSGRSLASTLNGNVRVPQGMKPILAWGENNGCLPEALELIADIYSAWVQMRSRWMLAILPVILFLFVGAIVLSISFALTFPFANLISNLT